mgnify:CR=1 FL=1
MTSQFTLSQRKILAAIKMEFIKLNNYITEDEFTFLDMAVEYWQDKEELINPSIDYVVDPTELLERLGNISSGYSEVMEPLGEEVYASLPEYEDHPSKYYEKLLNE